MTELHELLKELLKELPCDYSAFIDVAEIDRRLKAFDELIKTYDEYDEDVYDYYEVMGLKVHEIIMKVKEQ